MKQFKVIDGGNQLKPPPACCDEFRNVEESEMIVATDKGYAAIDSDNAIIFDVRFCPFCGAKLPTIQ